MLPRVPFLSIFLFVVVLVVSLSLPCRSDGFAEKEKTLAIIKPDGLYDNCTDKIKNAIFDSGFTIVKEMLIQLDEEAAMSFYAEHSSRSFFSSLVKYMTRYPLNSRKCFLVSLANFWTNMFGWLLFASFMSITFLYA
ncbi:PREDICTED: nucleoside-diphosphate kinase [Prunus dulcis]|uniref:PREDICTED: nucleoside-diphosphate kinase n=1 Tax=Prunus dulcis TaxID=3755 RepID=A0A5E4EY84_PRUDU|nr:PREDICTED: nucleoside-diphosphate kinase [Prunus dulcis]